MLSESTPNSEERETIEIPRPHVPFGPEQMPEMLADADYLDHAARNIAGGYSIGGYNVTATVIKLLHDTASALRTEFESCVWDFEDGSSARLPHDPAPNGVCVNCLQAVRKSSDSEERS